MRVDDFVMLGRTVPEHSKKYGETVCSAGYSKELRSLLRVYPLPRNNGIKLWTQCRIPMRRPNHDNREESWRIDAQTDDAFEAMRCIDVLGEARKDKEFDFLKSLAVNSIAELNEKRRSLAIVAPTHIDGYFEQVKGVDPYWQETLFERVGEGKPDINPRLHFTLDDGEHRLQYREWGVHELIRKDRKAAERLFDVDVDRLKLTDPAWEHLLFIGNMNTHRNNWLVINKISRKRQIQSDLFM